MTTPTNHRDPFTLKPVSWAAELMGVSPDTIRRMISRGELAGYKVGRSLRVKDTDVYSAIQPVHPATEDPHNRRLVG